MTDTKGSGANYYGPRRLGRHLTAVAGKALGKHGLALGGLIADWAGIVGTRLADQTLPMKLVFPAGRKDEGVLHLRVASPMALLIQHEEPQVVERINAFFGWRAVKQLKLVHGGPLSRPRPALRPPAIPPGEARALLAATETVADDDLRSALQRLGRAMAGQGG